MILAVKYDASLRKIGSQVCCMYLTQLAGDNLRYNKENNDELDVAYHQGIRMVFKVTSTPGGRLNYKYVVLPV